MIPQWLLIFPPGGHIYLLSKTFCSYFSISNNLKTPSLFSFCPGSLDNFFLVTSLASLSFFYCHQLGLYRLFPNHCKTSMKSPSPLQCVCPSRINLFKTLFCTRFSWSLTSSMKPDIFPGKKDSMSRMGERRGRRCQLLHVGRSAVGSAQAVTSPAWQNKIRTGCRGQREAKYRGQ